MMCGTSPPLGCAGLYMSGAIVRLVWVYSGLPTSRAASSQAFYQGFVEGLRRWQNDVSTCPLSTRPHLQYIREVSGPLS